MLWLESLDLNKNPRLQDRSGTYVSNVVGLWVVFIGDYENSVCSGSFVGCIYRLFGRTVDSNMLEYGQLVFLLCVLGSGDGHIPTF